MKKQFALLGGAFVMTFFIFGSCNKNDNPPSKTKTQLLTQGSWKFKSATANGSDVSSSLQACQKDNIYTFVAAGTGTADEGATKCNAADPQTTPFTWNLQNNETTLFISTVLFTGGSSTFSLVSVSETELVVSQSITVNPAYTPLVVVTFTH